MLHNSVNPLRLRDGRLLLLGQHARFWSQLRVIVLTSKTRLLGMPTSMPTDRGVARCGLRARGEVPRRKLRRCECVYYVGRSRAQVRQRVCVGLLAGGGRGAVPRARPIPTVVLPGGSVLEGRPAHGTLRERRSALELENCTRLGR